MARIYLASTLKRAQAVLNIMETIIDEDLDSSYDICVSGFRSGSNTGLSLSIDGLRRCNISGEPSSDGIMVVTGGPLDFSHIDGRANEATDGYSFAHDEFYQAARFALDWLCKGQVNYPHDEPNDE